MPFDSPLTLRLTRLSKVLVEPFETRTAARCSSVASDRSSFTQWPPNNGSVTGTSAARSSLLLLSNCLPKRASAVLGCRLAACRRDKAGALPCSPFRGDGIFVLPVDDADADADADVLGCPDADVFG